MGSSSSEVQEEVKKRPYRVGFVRNPNGWIISPLSTILNSNLFYLPVMNLCAVYTVSGYFECLELIEDSSEMFPSANPNLIVILSSWSSAEELTKERLLFDYHLN